MKIGIITDIHNNVIALESVLAEIEASCDCIICSGDIIGIGPYPEETVQRMMKIKNLIAVRGNHERYLLEGISRETAKSDGISDSEKKHHKWEHKRLSKESIAFLKALPYKKEIEIDGKRISILHYAMDDQNKYSRFKLSDEELKYIFKAVDPDIIIYGHNHSRNICKSDKFYINVGSLGCPAQDKNIARYGILEISNDKVHFESKELIYNVQFVIDKMNEYNYPDADKIKSFFYGV